MTLPPFEKFLAEKEQSTLKNIYSYGEIVLVKSQPAVDIGIYCKRRWFY